MSNNIDDIQKQLEEFSSNFLELSKLQKLLLNYISSIKEQKDEIVALYEKNFNETKDLSNIIELLFEENLIKESKKIEDEIEKEYQKLEKILVEYSKTNDLTKQIQDLDDLCCKYKQYISDFSKKTKENYSASKKFFRKSIVFNLFMFIIFSLIILAYMYFYK